MSKIFHLSQNFGCGITLFVLWLSVAHAEVLGDDPKTFDPITSFMYQQVGTIIVSNEQIVFPGGAKLQLIFVKDNSSGNWPVTPSGSSTSAKIYEVDGEIPRLKGGGSLCGDEVPVRYLAVWPDIDPTNDRRSEARFNFYSSDTPPLTDKSKGWCLTLITYTGKRYDGPTYEGTVWTQPSLSTTPAPTTSTGGKSETGAGVTAADTQTKSEPASEASNLSDADYVSNWITSKLLFILLLFAATVFLIIKFEVFWKSKRTLNSSVKNFWLKESTVKKREYSWRSNIVAGVVGLLIAAFFMWNLGIISPRQPQSVEVKDEWKRVANSYISESSEWPGIYLKFTCWRLGDIGRRYTMSFSTLYDPRAKKDEVHRLLRRHQPEDNSVVVVGRETEEYTYKTLSALDLLGGSRSQPQVHILAELIRRGSIKITSEGKTVRFYAGPELEALKYGVC